MQNIVPIPIKIVFFNKEIRIQLQNYIHSSTSKNVKTLLDFKNNTKPYTVHTHEIELNQNQ